LTALAAGLFYLAFTLTLSVVERARENQLTLLLKKSERVLESATLALSSPEPNSNFSIFKTTLHLPHVNSIETFLEQLPKPQFLSHFALAYRSQSLQGAPPV
jgi:hypothetical protein